MMPFLVHWGVLISNWPQTMPSLYTSDLYHQHHLVLRLQHDPHQPIYKGYALPQVAVVVAVGVVTATK